jgi:Sec-independent protein translocase protein TatA
VPRSTGQGHLILLLVIVLLVLVPGQLPETGAAIGRGMHDCRAAVQGQQPRPQDEDGTRR